MLRQENRAGRCGANSLVSLEPRVPGREGPNCIEKLVGAHCFASSSPSTNPLGQSTELQQGTDPMGLLTKTPGQGNLTSLRAVLDYALHN